MRLARFHSPRALLKICVRPAAGVAFVGNDECLGRICGVFFNKEPGACRPYKGLRSEATMQQFRRVLPFFGGMAVTHNGAIVAFREGFEGANILVTAFARLISTLGPSTESHQWRRGVDGGAPCTR